MNWDSTQRALPSHPQLGVKALTYNDLIQAQKEISAHNQQLRAQSEQLEKDNSELRSQSLRLVCGAATAGCARVGGGAFDCPLTGPEVCSGARLAGFCMVPLVMVLYCVTMADPLHCPRSLALAPFGY